jgi:hypothetical protein
MIVTASRSSAITFFLVAEVRPAISRPRVFHAGEPDVGAHCGALGLGALGQLEVLDRDRDRGLADGVGASSTAGFISLSRVPGSIFRVLTVQLKSRAALSEKVFELLLGRGFPLHL